MKKRREEQGVMSQGPIRSGSGHKKTYFIVFLLMLVASHFSFPASAFADAGEIKSKAAVVMDAVTGRVLYAKNPDVRLLPASTTKLMTALVVVERARLSDVVTVSKRAAGQPATRVGLRAGDKFTIENLLYAALMKSANDAAVALAEAVGGTEERFVDMMNQKAAAIGANDTHFVNANGLPEPGQYITAYDLSKIMRQAIRYPVLKEILGTRVTAVSTEAGKSIPIRSTNKLLWSDNELVGGKTGYTRLARHCFVCAGERENDTIIVALLGAPYRDLLWKESEGLMGFGEKVLNKTEEPVIFLTKTDHASVEATKVAYAQESGPAGDDVRVSKKTRKARTVLARHKARRGTRHKRAEQALAAADKPNKGKVVLAKNDVKKTIKRKGKKGTKQIARSRKTKKMVAKKEEDAA